MLYRLLRPGESIENGISAKNLDSKTSVFVHVTKGSYGPQSKYISTCGTSDAVEYLKGKSQSPGKIVKIDEDRLRSSGAVIIDLRFQETRDHYIDDGATEESISKFNNFAKKFQEVLIVDKVPKECIIDD